MNLFLTLRPAWLLGLGAVLAAVSAVIYGMELDGIHKREHNLDDRGFMGKKEKRKKPGAVLGRGFFVTAALSAAAILSAAVIGIVRPVSDVYYYAGGLLALGAVLFNMIEIIRNYNRLAMRRLPQFDKKEVA